MKKLTKSYVDKLPFPEKGQVFYRDPELKGFALRATKGSKTYIVETSVRGKTCRVTIGKHGVFSPDQARIQAKKLLADMAMGINPNQQKQQERARTVTLQQAFNQFMQERQLKPHTRYDYGNCFEAVFKSWHHKQIFDIKKPMVSSYYEKLCAERGEAYANLSMRFLRSLLNFANAAYEDNEGNRLFTDNPVTVLSDKRQWRIVARRERLIKAQQLPIWWSAVQNLSNTTHRDYFILLLLTGLRKREAATLNWDNVDLDSGTIKIIETKNSQPHTLPLSDFLQNLLEARLQGSTSQWVFEGRKNKPIVESRHQINLVQSQSGIEFSCHDLRRTFATIAENLDISQYTIKRLLNHTNNQDVTAGYIIKDIERIRTAMQQITDSVIEKCRG
ncbi:integrase family protein, partial [Candidatus Albibeggiatoa sp. nov. BB20]|uniref:tyrosine-type recombinase/integrase n=1 Tax=Candidatus Albibeggiatoa sp. nov. BB20 TaxID=3162723 RepID=UPI0033658415